MADRGNQVYQVTPQTFSSQGGGQNRPPGVTINGPIQPSGAFQPGPIGVSQTSQTIQPVSGGPQFLTSINGYSGQLPLQQTRMPGMIPSGFSPVLPTTAQLSQIPSSLSTQRPPGQFPPPLSSVHPSGPLMNGSNSMNIRPSVSSSLSPASRSIQKPEVPPPGYQESATSTRQGTVPPIGGPMPSAFQPQSSSNLIQTFFSADIQDTTSGNILSRPNELPVPFHGQGQYSHQVNPLLQNTPIHTPSNSGPPSRKSSRGPSPIPGSAIDALEGQFTPGSDAPYPSFSGARASPNPSNVPSTSPKATETFTPPPQGQVPSHSGGQTAFSLTSQQLPPRPGFPAGPPKQSLVSQQNQQLSGQLEQLQFQQPLFLGQRTQQAAGFPALTTGQPAGFPPVNIQPRVSSPSGSNIYGYPQPPMANASGVFLPPPPSGTPGSFLPPSGTTGSFPSSPTGAGLISPPRSAGHVLPPPMSGAPSLTPAPQFTGPITSSSQFTPQQPHSGLSSAVHGHYPASQYGQTGPGHPGIGAYPSNINAMTQSFDNMSMQHTQRVVNLLNERHLIPPDGIETAKPTLPQNFKNIICSPDVFRCTLNAVPQNSALLNKARLPLGILIHPFKDLSQLPVIQSSVIVRCRSCRSYINPFVAFIDQRKWKCNMCYRANELPDEFSYDPVSKTYGDPQRRPEVRSATIEFIAPTEYMLRPPQPAVYLFLLDVSFNAVETGYLSQFCQVLLDQLDKLPGDARTSIGFLCYDRALYYFNLADGLTRPHMLCVPDLEDPLLPSPDSLLVNLHESKELVIDLLNQLPKLFEGNYETGSALGAALQSAHKLMSPTGGRITVMQTCLPTVGPGALQNRDAETTPGKSVTNLGPATDFYKKLSLDCSAQQIAVDLFMLNGQYSDIATLSCISKYSAGCIYYYPSFHTVKNPGIVSKFNTDFRRYLTRKIGFESVMRIRCTRGLSIHTFHGNFFVRSTDLLSLPNINPDAAFGMQMSIEENLVESRTVSFQAALLYTSTKGERRIRVHTLCLPVTDQLSEVFTSADQLAIAALLAEMAVERSLNSAISNSRDSMINAALETLMAYSQQIPASQRVGALLAPYSLRLMPMLTLAMLKNLAFSLAGNINVDDRVFAMQQCKVLPVCFLIQKLLPHLYPLHQLSDEQPVGHGKDGVPSAPLLSLSSASIDRTGLFLLDTGEAMFLLVGSEIGNQMCQDVFGVPDFISIPEGMADLPKLENPVSNKIHSFINNLRDSRPHGITFTVIRDDSKNRWLFSQHLLEDRTENSMSYYEFLQFLQGKAKG